MKVYAIDKNSSNINDIFELELPGASDRKVYFERIYSTDKDYEVSAYCSTLRVLFWEALKREQPGRTDGKTHYWFSCNRYATEEIVAL